MRDRGESLDSLVSFGIVTNRSTNCTGRIEGIGKEKRSNGVSLASIGPETNESRR